MFPKLALILLLPLIAALILWDGLNYNPDEIHFKDSLSQGTAEISSRLPHALLHRDLKAPPREFTKENLYEYVNGHAEFFISAGFRSLISADYLSSGPDPSFVVDVYDMGNAANAFGVLMEEGGGEKVPVGFQGFSAPNLLTFIRGPYYLKVAVFEEGLDIHSLGKELDAAFLDMETNIPQFDLLPAAAIPGSESFIKEDFMGQDFLKDVYLKEYEEGERRFRVFLCLNAGEGEGTPLEKWLRFYREGGIKVEEREDQGRKYFVIVDSFEGPLALFPMKEYLFGFAGEWEGSSAMEKVLQKE